jgi:flavin-dependent dehydrogenase
MDYDVLIVGARVAGASLALLLGQRGYRVLLIDRDRFPSDTLSTHFMGTAAVPLLAKLGVLDDVEAGGFRRMTRTRTWVEDCLFEGPIAPDGSYALAPRRDCLDATLIRHAVSRGSVEFWEGAVAEGLIEEEGRVVGARISRSGQRHTVRARVVVGADGKYSKVAAWVRAACYNEVPAMRPGYYGYYHGVGALTETALELFYSQRRIGFIFPMQPGVDCLGLALQPDEFDVFRKSPRQAFEDCFRTLSGMTARLEGARLEGKLRGMRGVDNCMRVPYGPGWALTGDAGCLKDPITGIGIEDALKQAFLLADALAATLAGAAWEATMGAFQQQRDEALLPLYNYTIQITLAPDPSPTALAWLRALLAVPPFTHDLAGGFAAVAQQAVQAHTYPGLHQRAKAFGAQPAAEAAPTIAEEEYEAVPA